MTKKLNWKVFLAILVFGLAFGWMFSIVIASIFALGSI